MTLPKKYTQLSINPNSDSTLIAQIKEQIAWIIASGEIQPGEKLPTIRNLADHLKVHLHTVREAYHRLEADQLVTIHTRRGTIVSPTDTTKFHTEQQKTSSNLLGVILPAPVDYYLPMVEAIQTFARENNYLPLFSYTFDNYHLTTQIIHQLLTKEIDGIILVSSSFPDVLENPSYLKALPPILSVDEPEMPGHSLLIDSKSAAYQLTRHLLSHGSTKISLITPPLDWQIVKQFYEGYQQALTESGIENNPDQIYEGLSFRMEEGTRLASQIFINKPLPDAVLTCSDSLALGVYQAADQLGLSIPDDLALAGYNDLPIASFLTPPLTTARIPTFEIGKRAIEILHSLIQNPEQATIREEFQPQLVVRSSCGCPPTITKED
jgi:DNA-binding LacI/PurR family transcriptional regulator